MVEVSKSETAQSQSDFVVHIIERNKPSNHQLHEPLTQSTPAAFYFVLQCYAMTSDRTHRMWWWLSGRLPVLSVSLHVDTPNPPPTGGKIKPVLTSKMTGSRWVPPPKQYFKTPSLNHIFSELSNHIDMELSQWTVLYTELYVSCGRFVEES